MDRAAVLHDVVEEVARLGRLRRELGRLAAPEFHAGAAAVAWVVAAHGPLRLSAVAELQRVDTSVVSRHVADLAAAGYLTREPDPADRRACLLALTPAGRDAVAAVHERIADRFAAGLASWPDTELAALVERLHRLTADVHAAGPVAAP